MNSVHQTAIVDPRARLGADVEIGPYSIVGPDVALGDAVVLHSHVVIAGHTEVGARTQIFPFASIGHRPQDLKYAGEPSELIIGSDNVLREHVTMNPGTEGGGMITRVGDRGLFMTGAHVAHDCQIGDRVIMANNATLGGHVVIEDDVILGGLSAVHQFVRIGRHAMIGGMSGVEHDVIPYGLATGERARLQGLNLVGMKRHGLARTDMQTLSQAYAQLFGAEDTLAERVERLAAELGESAGVADIVAFVRAKSSRPLCRPKSGNGG
ncbi:MAG: acyl-ACP--UDP-N-acetylglucosamine O-acyltransferase [Alphaproteobacteria bacterium]